ncbi:MAG: reprolysin-like metallopeptidase [Candidatus Promineifilaceae bacterium]
MLNKKIVGLVLLLMSCVVAVSVTAQTDSPLWQDVSSRSVRSVGQRVITPTEYRLVQVDLPQLREQLAMAPLAGERGQAMIMQLPMADGNFGRFEITNAPIMQPELAAQYPEIQTYTAQGIDDPTATGRLDLTPHGFHAFIQSEAGTNFIDPYQTHDIIHYISYDKTNYVKPLGSFVEGRPSAARLNSAPASQLDPDIATGSVKRTYEFVMAASGEYTDYICTQGGDCSNAAAKRATAFAAIVVGMNRVTQIYERDLTISFMLVSGTNNLVFTDKDTDPFTDGSDADTILNELANAIDGVIPINSYDLGHGIGSNGGGGVAHSFTCGSSDHDDKASGATTLGAPIGDPFWVDYTAHEIGHQFNANHSYNASAGGGCTTRVGSVAYEPGSGTTIMSYAGICGDQNTQPNADAMFNAGAISEIIQFVTSGNGASCATTAATGNTEPTVEAGNNYTIPKETPFRLSVVTSDNEQAANALTTSWEQYSVGTAWSFDSILPNTDQQDNQARPILRVFAPSSSVTRIVPALANILDGTYENDGEDLPSIDQTLTFRATVRDNVANGGGVASDDMQVMVEDGAGPFRVTSHASNATLPVGATTVTWDVANTNLAPVNCTAVDIAFSSDGGATFPFVLATSTSNDGTESVTLPNTSTTQGRIQVKCSNNIFFDINKGSLTLSNIVFTNFVYMPIVTR